jgi:hypothetical protein
MVAAAVVLATHVTYRAYSIQDSYSEKSRSYRWADFWELEADKVFTDRIVEEQSSRRGIG